MRLPVSFIVTAESFSCLINWHTSATFICCIKWQWTDFYSSTEFLTVVRAYIPTDTSTAHSAHASAKISTAFISHSLTDSSNCFQRLLFNWTFKRFNWHCGCHHFLHNDTSTVYSAHTSIIPGASIWTEISITFIVYRSTAFISYPLNGLFDCFHLLYFNWQFNCF